MFLEEKIYANILKSVPVVTIDLCVIHKNKILLGKRNNPPAKNYFFVPGGRIFKNETLDQAFDRIIEFELGSKVGNFLSKQFLGTYEHFYKVSHRNFHLKDKFVYGLSEINRDIIKKSKFISNPGCYPTSILIPLIPLLEKKIIDSGHVIIDSKSGISGAGKKSVENNLSEELKDNFYSYSVTSHKHFPEIDQEIKKFNNEISFTFLPNLLPIFCGLQSNIYIDHKDIELNQIREVIDSYYDGELFIKTKNKKPTKLSDVQGTNNVLINIFEYYEKKKILIISSIDNLIKGASGQAIQNMNLMFGFKENESLI